MVQQIIHAESVDEVLAQLRKKDPKKLKKVLKCLRLLAQDPHYPSLASHPYDIVKGPLGERLWESYVENNTPSAWRVWWFFGPEDGQISVVRIAAHP